MFALIQSLVSGFQGSKGKKITRPRQASRPGLEALEDRQLLSTVVAPPVNPPMTIAQIRYPAPVTPPTTPVVSLTINPIETLTTSNDTVANGQQVTMTFTETNPATSSKPIIISFAKEGFQVFNSEGIMAWTSNPGPIQPLGLQLLQPGQSITRSVSWTPTNLANGNYTIENEMDPKGATATLTVVSPTQKSLQITNGQGQEITTISNNQPVTLTFTETNQTLQPVKITVPLAQEGFKVYDSNNQLVWTSNPGPLQPMGVVLETLQPGQSFSRSVTWTPVNLSSGTYTVTSELDGGATAVTVTVPATTSSTAVTTGIVGSLLTTSSTILATGQGTAMNSGTLVASGAEISTGSGTGGGTVANTGPLLNSDPAPSVVNNTTSETDTSMITGTTLNGSTKSGSRAAGTTLAVVASTVTRVR